MSITKKKPYQDYLLVKHNRNKYALNIYYFIIKKTTAEEGETSFHMVSWKLKSFYIYYFHLLKIDITILSIWKKDFPITYHVRYTYVSMMPNAIWNQIRSSCHNSFSLLIYFFISSTHSLMRGGLSVVLLRVSLSVTLWWEWRDIAK